MPKDTPSTPETPAGLADILAMQSQQLQLLQQLVTRLIEQRDPTSTHAVQGVPAIDPYGDLVRDLPAFVYDKDDDTTFDAWYKRYGPVIEDRGAALTEERRRNLVIDKLDNATYKSYAEHVLPLKPRDIDFATTIQKLTLLFGPKRTLIRRRFDTVYDVLVNGTVQRRHANQMRPHGAAPTDEGLLDLFDLPTQLHKRDEAGSSPSVVPTIDSPTATTTPTTTLIDAATPAIETSDSSASEPVQRPQRQRHPPRRLEMNPLVKSYM
ncbi:unnamed protein product [Heligmosomoides polygyrus]|uniref:DUF148 domain-containing protein n=1 Tax=Heligmosomoides polygyrus TaxID=6339 RepID=A0A183FQX0_HELPZ|nr:unnamed protein product [Heligmosomoides polygyrus]